MRLSDVKLTVFDVTGKIVKVLIDGKQNQGNYKVDFNGANLSSGIYIYKIEAGEFTDTKKMVLLK